jgi:hypothetical protein
MEQKIRHLEMIQAVISRMAGNSFLIKGWCVTLVAGLFALGSSSGNLHFVILAYFPTMMFWLLDSYYLWQERLFRRLYDDVRSLDDSLIDFSMSIDARLKNGTSWSQTGFSRPVILFYGTIVAAILTVLLLAR